MDAIERRAHARFEVLDPRIVRLLDRQDKVVNLVDLSYSGFAVNAAHGKSDFANIVCLDHAQEFKAHRVFENANKIGYRFIHESSTVLIFLRPILEGMANGRSLVPISKDLTKEKFQGEEYTLMRGDGPTDLVIKMQADQPESILLTFRADRTYREVRYASGEIRTGMTTDDQLAAQMYSTRTADPAILRPALMIFEGIADPTIRSNIKPVVDLCHSVLMQTAEAASA